MGQGAHAGLVVTQSQPVLVLGAGMVGVCTALHLQQRGVPTVLLDRWAPGQETSHGNAGLIQQEAVAPYPFPFDLPTLLNTLTRQGGAVHWHADALPGLLPRLARYAAYSRHQPYARITRAYAALIAHATAEHAPLIDASGAAELVRHDGYRDVFRSARALDTAVHEAQSVYAPHGVPYTVEDAAALQRAEPGLHPGLAGAIHWTSPWAVQDPSGLVAAYAHLFVQRGGTLRVGDARTLRRCGARWQVDSADGAIDAAQVVLALGPWSPGLLRQVCARVLPQIVKRGYHQHYAAPVGLRAPVLDAERGYVLAPMRRGLRLTTGAELARLGAPPTPVQLQRAQQHAHTLLDLGQALPEPPWLGNRPCMPDMLPVIGAVPGVPGLWLNTGHGHQGFTLGPVSGRLLAEQMLGDAPLVAPEPYLPARWG